MPTPLLRKRGVVLAKLETTYGADIVPTVADNALLVEEPMMQVEHEPNLREGVRETLSRNRNVEGPKSAKFDCSAEFKTDGAAADGASVCELSPLLRACGLVENTVAEVALNNQGYTSYIPLSAAFPSASIYYHRAADTDASSVLHKATGCVGNASFTLEAGKIPKVTFAMQGKYHKPADSTTNFGSPGFDTSLPQMIESIVATFAGYEQAVVGSVTLDLGNVIAKRSNLNTAYYDGGSNLTFAENTPAADTITRSAGNWYLDGFRPGMTIRIVGSATNDGSYTIATMTSTILTLLSTDDLTAEGPTGSIIGIGTTNEAVEGFAIVDRAPSWSAKVECCLGAAYDFWALLDTGAAFAISAVVADASVQNRVYFSAPYCTIGDAPKWTDNGGIWTLEMSGPLYGDDNELLIVQGYGTVV